MTNPSDAAFNDFWQAYPRKVGKFDALRAFTRALRVATVEEILSGVETYKTHKPDYADWSHPASWLNKGRWMDDYTPPPVEKPKTAAYKPYVPLKFRKDWGA